MNILSETTDSFTSDKESESESINKEKPVIQTSVFD